MNMVTDEIGYVKKSLRDKKVLGEEKDTIRLLAKHWLGKKYNKDKTMVKVGEFMAAHKGDWSDMVNNIVSDIEKHDNFDLRVVDKVVITEAELMNIKMLEQLEQQRLAFVLLVYAKVEYKLKAKSDYFVNAEWKQIKDDAGLNGNLEEHAMMRFELKQHGLISPVRGYSTKINFVNEESPVAITVEDFTGKFVDKYLMWCGVIESKECATDDCVERVKLKSNRSKYCTGCAKNRINEKQKVRDNNSEK